MIQYRTLLPNDELLLKFKFTIFRTEPDSTYRYWFTSKKFDSTGFFNIEAALIDNEIIGISGCSQFNDTTLRIAQMHYTIPEYRPKFRDLLIRENGFIDRHIQTALSLNLDTMLIAIHAFNKKTETIVNVYEKKRKHYRHLKNLTYSGVQEIFGINQHCYEMKI